MHMSFLGAAALEFLQKLQGLERMSKDHLTFLQYSNTTVVGA